MARQPVMVDGSTLRCGGIVATAVQLGSRDLPMTESRSESLWKHDQNSRSHTVARKREFATFRLKSTSNPLRITMKTRRNLTENIHSETLSRVSILFRDWNTEF